MTSSGGSFDLAALTDGDLAKSTLLPAAPVGEQAWIQYEFPQPQTMSRPHLYHGRRRRSRRSRRGRRSNQQLEASDDGEQFRVVAPIPGGARTIAFPRSRPAFSA